MNSNAGAKQITANSPISGPNLDAAFEAWLTQLPFAVEPAELGRVRAGFERLAAMNRLNRTSSSQRLRPTSGGDV